MRDRSIRKQADWNQFDTEFATNLILFIQIPAVKHVNNVNFNFIRFGEYIVNPLTPRSDCKFSPLAATHFLVDKSQEFGVNQDSNVYLISQSVLVPFLQDSVWILQRGITC